MMHSWRSRRNERTCRLQRAPATLFHQTSAAKLGLAWCAYALARRNDEQQRVHRYEFRRTPDDPVRFVVSHLHDFSEAAARLAFENYIAKNEIPDDGEVTIAFAEWFPPTESREDSQ